VALSFAGLRGRFFPCFLRLRSCPFPLLTELALSLDIRAAERTNAGQTVEQDEDLTADRTDPQAGKLARVQQEVRFLTPHHAGRRFSPPLSAARVRVMCDQGLLTARRTENGWRLIEESSLLRLIKQREQEAR
jgi:hypothetical protein